MFSPYQLNDFDEIFDNDNDFSDDLPSLDRLLCDNETLGYMDDCNIDTISDRIIDCNENKFSDNPYLVESLEDLEPTLEKSMVKTEPSYTNSLSSGCVTDDSSHPSSINNSPVARKVKKREYQEMETSSGCSPSNYKEDSEISPTSAKLVKEENVSPYCKPIYKLSINKNHEARPQHIYINNLANNSQSNVVTIRRNVTSAPTSVPCMLRKVHIKAPKFAGPESEFKPSLSAAHIRTTMDNSFLANSVPSPDSGSSDYERETASTGDYYNNSYKSYRGPYYTQSSLQYNKSGSNCIFQHPIPRSGNLILTDEEKNILHAEGFDIPTRLPLNKTEERNLKRVRRKIKNKISAQESRRKKKEYVEAMEKKIVQVEQERNEYKKKLDVLENNQRSLQNQIRHLQQQLTQKNSNNSSSSHHSANTSSTLMMFMLCFVLVLFGGSASSSYSQMSLPTSSLISSSSFYNMGYGPGWSGSNYSEQLQFQKDQLHSSVYSSPPPRFKTEDDQKLQAIQHPTARPSILLGDDSDESNFEDLIRNFGDHSRKYRCSAKARIERGDRGGGGQIEFRVAAVERKARAANSTIEYVAQIEDLWPVDVGVIINLVK